MAHIKPLKVLCLHGFRTNGSVLRSQIERANIFPSGVQLEFINAPHAATGPPEGAIQAKFSAPFFQWWDAKKINGVWHYDGWEHSISQVTEHLKYHGPYDGILGFSQGAAVATAVLAVLELEKMQQQSLRLAILIAGFPPRCKSFNALLTKPLETPSLHLYGRDDPILPAGAGKRLASVYQSAAVIEHEQGHVVPKLDEDALDAVASFVQSLQDSSGLR